MFISSSLSCWLLVLVLCSLLCLQFAEGRTYHEQGKEFLQTKALERDVYKLGDDSGVLYKVLEKGPGLYRAADQNQEVKTTWIGYHMDYEPYPIFGDEKEFQLVKPEELMECWRRVLLQMVEGDRWEVYCPPKLASQLGADITGEVFIFDMTMIEIVGEKKRVHACTIDMTVACTDQEVAYIMKTEPWDTTKIDSELERLLKIEQDGMSSMTPDKVLWFQQRISILKQRQTKQGSDNSSAGNEL